MVKNKTMNKQTIAIAVLSILLVALLVVNLTYAYFTDTTDESNAGLKFGHLVLTDTATIAAVGGAKGVIEKVVPGDTVEFTFAGSVDSETNIDFYTVMKLSYEILEADGATPIVNADTIALLSNTIEAALKTVADTWSKASVAAAGTEDQYYVNTKAVTAESLTTNRNLFGTEAAGTTVGITFDKETYGNDWQDVTINITAQLFVIQSKNLEDTTANDIATLVDTLVAGSGVEAGDAGTGVVGA